MLCSARQWWRGAGRAGGSGAIASCSPVLGVLCCRPYRCIPCMLCRCNPDKNDSIQQRLQRWYDRRSTTTPSPDLCWLLYLGFATLIIFCLDRVCWCRWADHEDEFDGVDARKDTLFRFCGAGEFDDREWMTVSAGEREWMIENGWASVNEREWMSESKWPLMVDREWMSESKWSWMDDREWMSWMDGQEWMIENGWSRVDDREWMIASGWSKSH